MPIAELVDAVVEATGVRASGAGTIRRVRTRLHHVHLPKLGNAGVVDYRRDTGLVVPEPAVRVFEPYLEWAAEHERR